MEATMFDGWVTDQQFVEAAQRHGIKVSKRTLRKWRQQRKLPYKKIGKLTLVPEGWLASVKLIGPR
jgi:transposase